ncbi:tRNA (N6-isopentenyl adenosine(37)-C2)-methylthiotransferase MiaB [Candidatus Bipolaricaulota bacterium]|nr:tRNA (N6-isopentenyl adenosine(37)-C2)-methylthiotransferase MiaB [Candidatus Bipolaricaulota bacterium]
MNLHQSEGIAGVLLRAGYSLVDSINDADVVLFNGCMVRQKAEDKLYGRIGAAMEEKRARPMLLGIGGCLGQVRGESLLRRFPAIDFVFGSRGHGSLPGIIEQAECGQERLVSIDSPTGIEEIPFERAGAVTAMVTISEGCSNFCSYCIVPHARGPMRSRSSARILDEVGDLVACGYQEVLLLGQNVNAFGRDCPKEGGFAELLERVADTGIPRVRFTTSHPRDMTQDVLEAMAMHENVCNHLHLPCQSGSDRLLSVMNRGYDRARYIEVVGLARKTVKGINVTTDLIVGHPGETDADFAETMTLIDEVRFGSIFVAAYSPRPLTRSAQVEDDVPGATKADRLQQVLTRQRGIALEENERFVGRDVEVLLEGETRDGLVYGRTADHRTVVVDTGAVGEWVTVRVDAATASGLAGSSLVPERVKGA